MNQWCTPRRFGQIEGRPFECGVQQNSLEHCLTCSVLQESINGVFRRSYLRWSRRQIIFLGYPEVDDSLQLYLILYTYLAFMTYNRVRYGWALNERLIRYILKSVCNHDPKLSVQIKLWFRYGCPTLQS